MENGAATRRRSASVGLGDGNCQDQRTEKMLKLVAGLLFVAPLALAQLNTLAQADGKVYFGSATDNPELTDTGVY